MKYSLTLGALLLMGSVGTAAATTLSTNIAADNQFQVYLSTNDAVQGTLLGTGTNWYDAYSNSTSSLAAGVNYFLHIATQNVQGPTGLLGNFSLSGADHVFSNGTTALDTNTVNWSGNTTGFGSAYSALTSEGTNGVAPWGTYAGISPSAQWILPGTAVDGQSYYFSTPITAVPVPAAVWLFGSALFGLIGLRRKSA